MSKYVYATDQANFNLVNITPPNICNGGDVYGSSMQSCGDANDSQASHLIREKQFRQQTDGGQEKTRGQNLSSTTFSGRLHK